MENRVLLKNLSLAMMGFIIIVGLGVTYWLYVTIYYQPPRTEDKSKKTEINIDLYNKISNPQSYGTPVTAEEPGYGRVNPFANYKAPPTPPPTAGAPVSVTGTTGSTSSTATAPPTTP